MEKCDNGSGYRPVFKRMTMIEWERYNRQFMEERQQFEQQRRAGQYDRKYRLPSGGNYRLKRENQMNGHTNSRSTRMGGDEWSSFAAKRRRDSRARKEAMEVEHGYGSDYA